KASVRPNTRTQLPQTMTVPDDVRTKGRGFSLLKQYALTGSGLISKISVCDALFLTMLLG
ncbi:hypothetical protein ACYBQ0_27465, partial [Klebsiella pneumoniae]